MFCLNDMEITWFWRSIPNVVETDTLCILYMVCFNQMNHFDMIHTTLDYLGFDAEKKIDYDYAHESNRTGL